MVKRILKLGVFLGLAAAGPARAQVAIADPKGDDKGPGNYTYPTDRAYAPGSFDITEFKATEKGGKVQLELTVAAPLADPWGMGTGFAVQMAFVFVKTGQGAFTEGLPGLNVAFAPGAGWDKVVVLSPQKAFRVKQEVKQKVDSKMAAAVVIPEDTRGKGSTITATVDKKLLGDGDLASWGWQVVMESNEGFPDKEDLLTRKVNEFEGQHRFGGGNDGNCDPHVMDLLGDDQKEQLAHECGPDGSSKKKATLKMMTKK